LKEVNRVTFWYDTGLVIIHRIIKPKTAV